MSERFYINSSLGPGPATLDGAEARHLAGVCRLRAGDQVCLFNGDGHEYPARIVEVQRRQIQLDILERLSPLRELPFRLEVAAPLPKGDRAQFLVEKLTELGVTCFLPLETRRSIVHAGEGKLEKLQRYVIEASKQCGRNVLMEVGAPVDWEAYCRSGTVAKQRFFGVPGAGTTLASVGDFGQEPVVCAVGPEGGWTDEEIDTALQAGWCGVSFGPRILRIETAALAAAAWFVMRANH
jgi:16S rRNA (uracil1498-N3)-methyltransferase